MRAIWLTGWMVLVASAATLDRVAVVVGKDVVTEGEVEDELRLEEFTSLMPPDLSPDHRRAAADRLVDQQLIRHEMEISGYKQPPAEEAAKMVNNFRQQHFQNATGFQASLGKYGITEDQLKQYFLWQLATLRFTDARFSATVPGSNQGSAERAAPAGGAQSSNEPKSPAPASPANQSADRSAASEPARSDVDALLDAWLRQARSSTRIEFKKEAFQ